MQDMMFCKQCWFLNPLVWPDTGEIIWYTQDKTGTQLWKDGKPFGAKSLGMTYVIDGVSHTGLPVYCGRRHLNFIEDTPEMEKERIRLQYSYGKICPYHDKVGAVCNVRYPCETCVVYRNYDKKVAVWQPSIT